MKRTYRKPTMLMVKLQHRTGILTGSNDVNNVDGNGNLGYGGEGDGPARVKTHNVWDEEW